MEKDQNTNSETQNNEAEEINAEELNNDTQFNSLKNKEQTKEITSEEKR